MACEHFLKMAVILGFLCLSAQADPREDFFERHIRPVLAERCHACHGADLATRKGDLRVDRGAALLKGGASGEAAVAPGLPEESLLLRALRYQDPGLQMPPEGPLPESVVAHFAQWIADGAYYPEPVDAPDAGAGQDHWAFQPPQPQALPTVRDTDWVQTPVDHFILARIEAEGLTPSPRADRATLLRRVSFDLTGLPPAAEEVEAFVTDPEPEAYAKLVDRLLASPAYGERWGRHWLDVARYADTKGYVYGDREEPKFVHSYVYRDWVIEALNRDLPYDEFIRLQLAADQISGHPEDLAAMGFLTLGQRFLGVMHDIIDDRIDTMTRGLLGLTVSCARCHDHKFDPVPIEDYYSLYGVFSNSSERLLRVESREAIDAAQQAFEAGLAEREAALRQQFEESAEALAERLRAQVQRYFAALPRVRELPAEDFYEIRNEHDLNPSITRRWHAYLEAQPETHPVFGPWKRLAGMRPERFAAEAPGILAAWPEETLNPLVRDALQAPPVVSLDDLAGRYGTLLQEAYETWREARAEADLLGVAPPNALPHPAREALRQTLYAEDAPVRVPRGAIVDLEWYFDEPTRVALSKLQLEIDRWIIQSEAAPRFSVALEDKEDPKDTQVFLRGNPAMRGAEVPRQFLEVLAGPDRTPFTAGSGRRELAEAIASPENPLTARVLVNRVWMHHFGAGLVTTPSDFGTRSATPSHPELLDWLARHFVEDGWSLKRLHRLVLMSATYQQASSGPADPAILARARQLDPENALLWRFQPQRLGFEALRDALLAVTGELDPALGGRGVPLFETPYPARRTIYGHVDRQFLPGVYRVFDFPNPDLHNPQRSDTTVPQQALFLMNSAFVQERARALVRAVEAESADETGRLTRMYQRAIQRTPTDGELDRAADFVRHATVAPPPPAPPARTADWHYGYGHHDEATGTVHFTALPHFTGEAWQGSAQRPDPSLGWVFLTAQGGHAGNDAQHAAIRRWVAPVSGVVHVTGRVAHPPAEGDGVQARLISNRHGVLGSWMLHNRAEETDFPEVTVEPGDTLDFMVSTHGSLSHDEFEWAPRIQWVTEATADSETASNVPWDAAADFAGVPEAVPVPLNAWEKLAQVLLLSNEFVFVQ